MSDQYPSRTALLVLDHQRLLIEGCTRDPVAHKSSVAALLSKARCAGIHIFYVIVSFRPGYPEVHANNAMFSSVRAGKRFLVDDPNAAIPAEIAPRPDEPVVVKHRVSAFAGTDLEMLLRARSIDTLVLFGITTSGVVTSTLRAAADLDYRLVVLSNLCADTEAELHDALMTRLFPRQAEVIDSDVLVARL